MDKTRQEEKERNKIKGKRRMTRNQERQDWKEIGMFQEEESDEVRTVVYFIV